MTSDELTRQQIEIFGSLLRYSEVKARCEMGVIWQEDREPLKRYIAKLEWHIVTNRLKSYDVLEPK